MPEQEKFYSFQFFCPKYKEREALRILRRRNDLSLSPYPNRAINAIVYGNGLEKVQEGVMLSGICFRNRLPKILERLSHRRITAFNDESMVQLRALPKIDVVGLDKHGPEAEDPRLRRN